MKKNKKPVVINTYLKAKDPDSKGIMEKVIEKLKKRKHKESAAGDTPIRFPSGNVGDVTGKL